MASGKRADLEGLLSGVLQGSVNAGADIDEPSDDELAALERELGDFDDESEEYEVDVDLPDAGADDAPAAGGLGALLAALGAGMSAPKARAEPEPDSQELSAVDGAARLLEFLLQGEHLELDDGGAVREIAPGVARILEQHESPAAQAAAMSNFLLAHPAVAELYVDDGSLEAILSQW
jgi:hypothetical protein